MVCKVNTIILFHQSTRALITCRVFLLQLLEYFEGFIKESLFSQGLSFAEHGFVVVLVLRQGLNSHE